MIGQTPNENSGTTHSGEQSSLAHKNFGLEAAQFDDMLIQLQAGENALFEKVFLSQFEESVKYLISTYGIQRSVAYDVTMDALLKFRKRLLAGKISYGNMRFLFTRMASQFLSQRNKHPVIALSENLNERTESQAIDSDVLDALDLAWQSLCKDCSSILNQYYYRKTALKTLAKIYGKSEAALRKQKQRCLDKLKAAFIKCYSPE